MDAEVSTHIPDNDYWGICLFHVVWTIFCVCNYSYVYTQNTFLLASDIFFINCAWQIIYPERVQILGHVHIICITVRENRIICCQIFCDLLLKSANERIFNVMQLILVKNKWHIKWKYMYLIQKFHDIFLSYYWLRYFSFWKEKGTYSLSSFTFRVLLSLYVFVHRLFFTFFSGVYLIL